MKMKTRFISMLLCIVMVLELIPGQAFAADIVASGYCGSEGDGTNLTWTLDNDGVLTISGTGEMADYSSYNSTPWYSYLYHGAVTSLIIEYGVSTIGDWAFSQFPGSLELPDSLISIGYAAFQSARFDGSLIIPSSVVNIDNYAFAYCDGFHGELVLSDSLARIGAHAFDNCYAFTGNLIIPKAVKSIDNYAFYNCWGFKGNLSLPDSLKYIGSYAFAKCDGFTGNLNFPESITYIGECAFWLCTGFTGNLSIPNSVTEIDQRAFWNCSGLTGNLTLSNSIKTINYETFCGCRFTGNLVIPNSVTRIASGAFSFCDFSGDLVIHDSVTSIGEDAFLSCNNLESACFCGDAPSMGGTAFANTKSSFTVYYVPGTSGWTDSDAYDAEAGTWNGYPLKTWNGKALLAAAEVSVPKGKYCIQVIDEYNAPISGATVTWDSSSASTDQDGNAFFDLMTGGSPVIQVSKADYLTWTNQDSNWEKNDKHFERVILYPTSYGALKLKSAKISGCDLLTQTKVLNLKNDGALIGDLNSGLFDLTCTATTPSEVAGYAIFQNEKRIGESTDGKFQDLNVKDFSKGGGCFIRVTGKDGRIADTHINLQFEENSVNEEFGFELKGNKISFMVSDDVPFVGGSTVSFELPAQAPAVVSVTEDKVQIGINLKLNENESTVQLQEASARTSYQTLLTDTYRNAQPVMISDGSALYAAFVRADADSSARYVAVTKFDGTSWCEPVRVDASAILDDAPQLCADGNGNLWLAYARTTGDPGESLLTYAQNQTIVVGTIDKDTLVFTEQKTYCSGAYMHLPTLDCVDGTPVLAWVDSAVTDEASVLQPNSSSVFKATYLNGAWTEAQETETTSAVVTSLCIGVKNGAPAVAYTADGQLCWNGSILAENVIGKVAFGRLPGTSSDSFLWIADSALHNEAGDVVPAERMGREFAIVGSSIYYNKSNGANANLAVLQYDSGNDHWGAPICLIGDEKYLEHMSVASLNGNTYAFGMHTTATITQDAVDDAKDLVWTSILPVSDLKIQDISFDSSELVPGEELPVTIMVSNVGDHEVTSLTVSVDGSEIASPSCSILPGESTEITVNISCPSEKKTILFDVQEPGEDDYVPEDNELACTIGSADAELELSLLQIGGQRSFQAAVVNHGLEAASGSILFCDSNGQVLAERTFENLVYGDVVIAEYTPEAFGTFFGEDVTATVTLAQEEPYTLNNSDSVPVLIPATEITVAYRAGNEIKAEATCMQDTTAIVYCAFYDQNGKMLGVDTQKIEPQKSTALSFAIEYPNAVQAKLFLLDGSGAPVCTCTSVVLES